MYKGLKFELEEVVSKLRIGEGIVIEHDSACPGRDRSIGYILEIRDSSLWLGDGRDVRLVPFDAKNERPKVNSYEYSNIKDIRVVDPIN